MYQVRCIPGGHCVLGTVCWALCVVPVCWALCVASPHTFLALAVFPSPRCSLPFPPMTCTIYERPLHMIHMRHMDQIRRFPARLYHKK